MTRPKGLRNRKSRPVARPCDTPQCRATLDVWYVPRWQMALCVECRGYAREFDDRREVRRATIKAVLRDA